MSRWLGLVNIHYEYNIAIGVCQRLLEWVERFLVLIL